jgi:predicted nucleotidyltransferase component of viral defense system
VYREQQVKQSELLQLLLLDSLYSQSKSGKIIFQGGTALRWVYGAARFSEDLDFVTGLSVAEIDSILSNMYTKTLNACIAQFGPGRLEQQIKKSRKSAFRSLFVYRPNDQRERIAVKVEFELLRAFRQPEFESHILRELPQVAGLVTMGELFLAYTSSIILAETPEEILSDKIRALFERKYIKGRDIYDIWWIVTQLRTIARWANVRSKMAMYQAPFVAAREAGYFQSVAAEKEIRNALSSDLPRFIPQNILAVYYDKQFHQFIDTVKKVTAEILDQGMRDYLRTDD